MTESQKMANLEHQVKLLQQKIELLELSLQIEERKLQMERLKHTNPYQYPYGQTWTNSTLGSSSQFMVDIQDYEALKAKIASHQRGEHDPGQPPVS